MTPRGSRASRVTSNPHAGELASDIYTGGAGGITRNPRIPLSPELRYQKGERKAMSGTPIKALRRGGYDIPNLGTKPARNDWPPGSRARGARPVPSEPAVTLDGLRALAWRRVPDATLEALPSAKTLAIEAMQVLRDIMLHGGGPESNSRVGAAKAILDRVAPEGCVEAQEPAGPDGAEIAAIVARHTRQAGVLARNVDPEPGDK